jgi:hypothetical protein
MFVQYCRVSSSVFCREGFRYEYAERFRSLYFEQVPDRRNKEMLHILIYARIL